MTNNDILRRIRYIFDLKDTKMTAIFALADFQADREKITSWLKKDDDPSYSSCSDLMLATFLNGFINHLRGKKEGVQHKPEQKLTNNIILMKLKIALNLKSEDIIDLLDSAGLIISKPELSAFFRKPGHKHYRECKDQFLRNFLIGLQTKHRGTTSSNNQDNGKDSSGFQWKNPT